MAACEAGLALAFILVLYRRKKTLDVSVWQDLREQGMEPMADSEPFPPAPSRQPMPTLPVAGREPVRAEDERMPDVGQLLWAIPLFPLLRRVLMRIHGRPLKKLSHLPCVLGAVCRASWS